MTRRALLVAATLSVSACTTQRDAERTLRAAGYREIEVTSWSPFVCGDDDTFATGFRAKNPAGQTVTGTVCCGLAIKGCTIRF